MNEKVNFYFQKGKWQKELEQLRIIVLDSAGIGYELKEELKWGVPCYTHQNKNVVLIHAFKEYCALLLFKGALMEDPHQILIQQTENVQSARQIRFLNLMEIVQQDYVIKAYIRDAIEVEKAGMKVEYKKTKEFTVPEEFKCKLDSNSLLKTAFESLTPGRQRGYLFYFSQAKQSKTRELRVEKHIPRILEGKGLDD
ncbi:MAG: DUF1801 domain-containing protein [Bacteroidota bacterium]